MPRCCHVLRFYAPWCECGAPSRGRLLFENHPEMVEDFPLETDLVRAGREQRPDVFIYQVFRQKREEERVLLQIEGAVSLLPLRNRLDIVQTAAALCDQVEVLRGAVDHHFRSVR